MHEFKHPKYYTELRKRNKEARGQGRSNSELTDPASISDQAISHSASTEANSRRASDPGLKLQALKLQAASIKPQATSIKLQAASDKLPDSIPFIKFQATSVMGLDYDKTILRMPHMKSNLVW